MIKNAVKVLRDFWREEEAVGVVEIILILVVLIALVVLFRDSLQDLVENILDKVTNSANAL
ncbi:MAG: holin, BlyA family protein [Blautia sp.]|nr:holin, BlyA family protein [Blautia sp.]